MGAWIETASRAVRLSENSCRTLTGAWIETHWSVGPAHKKDVAPSRVRGLKLCQGATFDIATTSHPHECVDCNAGTLLYVAYLQFVMDRKEEKE